MNRFMHFIGPYGMYLYCTIYLFRSFSRSGESFKAFPEKHFTSHVYEDDHKDFPTKIPDDVDQILTHEYCAVVFTCRCHPPSLHTGVILFCSISPTLN